MSSGANLHLAKRQLILRDSLAFLILVFAVLVLYAITSFLFHSFEERRADLSKQFGALGDAALRAGHADQAIVDLRTALSYGPEDRSNHLLLAEALAQAHHTEEATDYFQSLWEAQPADGFINLQLARLARQRDDRRRSIDYYLASASGSWPTDSDPRRQQVQLELSDYLMQLGDLPAARSELLIAAANTPETAETDTLFGDKLLETRDPGDAMTYYRKALALKPHDATILQHAGNAAFATADYAAAHHWLSLALVREHDAGVSETNLTPLRAKVDEADRLTSLNISRSLSPEQRAEHLIADAAIARRRLDSCAAQWHNQPSLPPSLEALKPQWQSIARLTSRPSLLTVTTDQDDVAQLIFTTEEQSSLFCGAPTGDDALLLLLANSTPEQVRHEGTP